MSFPGETDNLAGRLPQRSAELRRELDAWEAEMASQTNPPKSDDRDLPTSERPGTSTMPAPAMGPASGK